MKHIQPQTLTYSVYFKSYFEYFCCKVYISVLYKLEQVHLCICNEQSQCNAVFPVEDFCVTKQGKAQRLLGK
jgi:hypothetical protein